MKRSSIMGFMLAAVMILTAIFAGTTAAVVKADEGGSGDITLTEYAVYEDVLDWVYESDMLMSYASGMVMDVDGNLFSEESFDTVKDGYHQCLILTKDNKSGALDYNGNLIIPFEYDRINTLAEYWSLAYYSEDADENDYDYSEYDYENDAYIYKRFVKTFVYYYGDGGPVLVAELDPALYSDIYAESNYLNVQYNDGSIVSYDTSFNILDTDMYSIYDMPDTYVSEYLSHFVGDYEGIVDNEGNTIIEPLYTDIEWHSIQGYFIVHDGTHYGIIDEEGNMLVPVEFDEIKTTIYNPMPGDVYLYLNSISNGYVPARIGDQAVFFNIDTQTVYETGVSADSAEFLGATLAYNDSSENTHVLSADGVDTDISIYSELYVMDNSAGMIFNAYDENDCHYVLDWHGNVLFSSEDYLITGLSADGRYMIIDDFIETTIYTVNYPYENAEAAPVKTETVNTETDTAETGTTETGTADGTSVSIIEQLLNSIKNLAEKDFDTNKDTIKSALDQVCSILGDSYPDTVFMLDSASRLIGFDAATGESVNAFIDAALAALGTGDETVPSVPDDETSPAEEKTEESSVDLSGLWKYVGGGYYEKVLNGEFENTFEDQAEMYGVVEYVMKFDGDYAFKYRAAENVAEVYKYGMSLNGDILTTASYNVFYALVEEHMQMIIDGDTLYMVSLNDPDIRITDGEVPDSLADTQVIVFTRTDGPDIPDVDKLEIIGDDPITGKWSVDQLITGEEVTQYPTDFTAYAGIIFTGGKGYFTSTGTDGVISTIIESYDINGNNLNFSSSGAAMYIAVDGQMILSQGETQYYLHKE